MKYIFEMIIIFLITSAVFVLGFVSIKNKKARAVKMEQMEWYQENIRFVSGGVFDKKTTQYKMVSINGGKTWAFIDPETEKFLYDGSNATNPIHKEVWGWHMLRQHIKQYGTITNLKDKRTQEILSAAGFTITNTNGNFRASSFTNKWDSKEL